MFGPSPSPSSAPLCKLIVHGAVGARIQVTDKDFRLCAEGTVLVEAQLLAGLYAVTWTEGRQVDQRIVRLRGDGPTTVEPSKAADAAPSLIQSLQPAADAAPRPSDDNPDKSDIVVFLTADDLQTGALELRLFDRDDIAMRSADAEISAAQETAAPDGSVAVRIYHVPPAVYRLQYRGVSGESLSQSVPAIAGRRTVMRLRAVLGQVLLTDGDKATTVTSAGVAPDGATMRSESRTRPLGEASDDRRLAEIMLSDLASGRTSLGRDLLARLQDPQADSLLRIYAAAVILARMDAGLSPSLEEEAPGGLWEPALFVRRWAQQATALLAFEDREGLPSDVAILRWKAEEALRGRSRRLAPLRSPPMLDCSWRWAMARSVAAPDNIPTSFSFRGAVRGATGARPWLAWRISAAKSDGAPHAGESSLTNLQDALGKLNVATQRILAASGGEDEVDPLAGLSADARALATTTLRLAPTGLAGFLRRGQVAPDVAKAFKAPASALLQRANRALDELNAIRAGPAAVAAGADPEAPRAAPALGRTIRFPDDPQKGRFGGLSEAGGFRLHAEFGELTRDWVAMDLIVTADHPLADGEHAEFFLHDSFDPDRYTEPFDGARAVLDVTAWGGFTVGVWIAGAGVELELDLALLPDAPQLVKDL